MAQSSKPTKSAAKRPTPKPIKKAVAKKVTVTRKTKGEAAKLKPGAKPVPAGAKTPPWVKMGKSNMQKGK